MLVPGDLGFSGLLLIFFLFFFCGPVVSFLVQKKWRIAAEKQEEIMRLVAMASEEAARAEFEANGVYDEVGQVYRPFKCAVCYCPTTTRCSRCKLVRYCSGKCQIIHWRRGHKEECHPPSTSSTHLNGPGGDSDLNIVLQGEHYNFYGRDLEMESRWNTNPLKRASKRSASSKVSLSPESTSGVKEDADVQDFMDGKEAHSDSRFSDTPYCRFFTSTTSNDSDTSGLRFSTSTSSNESLVDAIPMYDSLSRSKGPLFDHICPDVVENSINANDTNSLSPEFTGLATSVNRVSFSSKLKPNIPSCRSGAIGCEPVRYSGSCISGLDECRCPEPFTCPPDFPEAKPNMSYSGNHVGHNGTEISEGGDVISPDSDFLPRFPYDPRTLENNDPYANSFGNKRPVCRVVPSEKMVRNACTTGVLPTKPSRSSDIYNEKSNDRHLESKGRRSLSSIGSEYPPCCGARRSSTSSVKPLKVENVHNMPTGLSEITSSLPNASNGLKTSVRKVVQQFRVPKPSKHNPFGLSEVAQRNNYKMLFPYDLFIKLYNWGKVEFIPCGLVNCGNSCYANAVLQCLAFTQPLTAYLLQGLHSKSCLRKEWCFTCEFECLIQKASEGNSPLSPIGILSQLQHIGSHLGHGREEDAHEFLRYAIDMMQSICLKEAGVYALSPLAEETTLVGLIFGGYLRSKIKCMKCHGKSERHERMMDLTVEIQGDIGTLEEALAKFTATEVLDGENKYLCSRCKSYEKAKKKLTVLEAPNVLTIAFKRFQSGKFGKLNKSVRFPEILNLSPYMSGKSDKSHVYRLYGVVVHVDVKNAAFSGHYVCYVKNIQGKWFKIDDSTVKAVEVERVLSKGAYMLLYSRCSPQPPSFIRNATMSNGIKVKRENSKKDATSTRPPMSLEGPWSLESFGALNRRVEQVNRAHIVDSSSDSSSLFSCSDESSCSTRDSTSTDDLSDYIFGGWNSPWRGGSDESEVSCSSPLIRSSHHPPPPYIVTQMVDGLQETERVSFLYSDTSKICRPDRDSCSSETNLDDLGWGNPLDGGYMRRPTWERTAQTFY